VDALTLKPVDPDHPPDGLYPQGHREAGDELAKLPRRQQEVAGCVAEGLTNEEIARRLVVTPGTVDNHVEAILRRLDLRSRTQVGVWAVERGLFRSDSEEGC
jgi:DNA-binding NarL/FixJ family response regulator